jgi:SAM domain (Sterile alpha motif)
MDISAWLEGLGLGQYKQAFHDNAVDANVLPQLTGEDLKEIGVTAVGHRRKLLEAIALLRDFRSPLPLLSPIASKSRFPDHRDTRSP